MEKWRARWRNLFGQTPVNIKGAYSYDETSDRLNLVLSRRFLSSHFKRTLAGGPNAQGRLEFYCGYNFYFMRHVVEQMTRGRFNQRYGVPMRPAISQRLIGDLEIDKGDYVWFRGYLQTPQVERIAFALLLLVIAASAFFLPWSFNMGVGSFLTTLLVGIFIPALLLLYSAVAFEESGHKLVEMLKLVMAEPLE